MTGALKVELHTHTADDPCDRRIPHTAEALIDRAAVLGYHALAITLHDQQIDRPDLVAHAAARGVVLLRGVERRLEGKHVLLINFPAAAQEVGSLEELAELKARSAGLVIAPHPFYPTRVSIGARMDRWAPVIDAVEWNALYTRALNFNRRAAAWARGHGKPLVGNGDVHVLSQLGTTWSRVDAACPPKLAEDQGERRLDPTPDGICDAIRAGRVEVETRPLSVVRAAWTLAQMLRTGVE